MSGNDSVKIVAYASSLGIVESASECSGKGPRIFLGGFRPKLTMLIPPFKPEMS